MSSRACRRWTLRGALVAVAAMAAACATPERVNSAAEARSRSVQERAVHTDLVRSMLAQHQYYAALAHIQEQKNRGPIAADLRYLEAEALRKLDRVAEADKLYRELLPTAHAGQAHHGLGLLYVSRNLDAAIGHLRQAVKRRPTDIEARNDLGYALMLAGRYAQARSELATAVELDPDASRSRNNLIVLMFLQRDEPNALRLADQANLSDEALAGLRQQAQSLLASAASMRRK